MTGGAGGLGSVITRVLLDDGFCVAVVDIDTGALKSAADRAEELGETQSVSFHEADITNEAAVEAVLGDVGERWSRVDALVNNAGIEPQHTIADLDMAVWDRTMSVNLRAPMVLVKHCVPFWVAQGGGTVVNLGSRSWASGSSTSSYVSSKAGLLGLTNAIAVELGPLGVTANLVAPSFVRTPFSLQRGDAAYIDQFSQRFAELSPLGRVIEPHDVAYAVAYLVSERARNVTGQTLYVAAGTQLAPTVRGLGLADVE